MPELNSFVDVAVGGAARRELVPVNDISPTLLITRCPKGLEAGTVVDFLYGNAPGRFRFWATCDKVQGNDAYFAIPGSIKTIESYFKRGTLRVSKLLPVQWRYAPEGIGYGDYTSASLMDLSCGGASLVMVRALKIGTQVEVRFVLSPNHEPFVELCEVLRASKIERSSMNVAGIRFISMEMEHQEALAKFLDDVRKTRRERGLV